MARINTDEAAFLENLLKPLTNIYLELNSNVIAVITRRMGEIGRLNAEGVQMLASYALAGDLAKINALLDGAQKEAAAAVGAIVEGAALYNDKIYAGLYAARGLTDSLTMRGSMLRSIMDFAQKNIIDDIVNLSHTTAFYLNGRPTSISETYINNVNFAAMQARTGQTDFASAVRSRVVAMTRSGLRVVDFDSGYHRRLDSQITMNVQEAISRMTADYRQQQGAEFGADGVEISLHYLCAPDHQPYQGKQYSNEEFEALQSRLVATGGRAIGTLNCKHKIFPIILGVSDQRHSTAEINAANKASNKIVTYKLTDGSDRKISRYNASQVQRRLETELRQMKEVKYQLEQVPDDIAVKAYGKKIRAKQAYYKQVSERVGLSYHPDRARFIKPE